MKKYRCTLCGCIYDSMMGDSQNGIESGTAFEDLPEEWICPVCGGGKSVFESVND